MILINTLHNDFVGHGICSQAPIQSREWPRKLMDLNAYGDLCLPQGERLSPGLTSLTVDVEHGGVTVCNVSFPNVIPTSLVDFMV